MTTYNESLKKVKPLSTPVLYGTEAQKEISRIGEEKKKGFWQSLTYEIGKPFGKTLSAVTSLGKAWGKFGEATGEAIGGAITGKKSKWQEKVIEAGQPVELKTMMGTYTPPERGLEALGYGIEIGTMLMGGKFGKPTTWKEAAKIGGKLGASYGLAKGLEEKEVTLPKIATNMATSSVIGAGTGAFTFIAQKGLQKVAENLYRALQKYSSNPKMATQEMIENKIGGSAKTIIEKVNPEIQKYEGMLQTEIRDSTEKITKDDIIMGYLSKITKYLEDTGKADLIPTLDKEGIIKMIDNALEKGQLPYKIPIEGFTLPQSLGFGREISRKITDPTWRKLTLTNEEVSNAQAILVGMRDSIYSLIKQKSPNTIPIFEDYAPKLAMKEGLENLIWKVGNKQMINTIDILSTTLAAFTQPVTAPEAIAVMGGQRLARGVWLPSNIASGSLKLADIMQKVSLPEAQAILQYVINHLISK